MVKIAHISTNSLAPWWFLRGQDEFLHRRGFEIHVIASPDRLLEKVAERDHVVVHAIEMSQRISPLRDLLSVISLFKLLRKLRPDIVHLSCPKGALLGAIASWVARVPVRIFFVRGLVTEGLSGLPRCAARSIERLTGRMCHQIIFVSHSLLDFARNEGIVESGQGMVPANGMSNGIDCRRFSRDAAQNIQLAADLAKELGLEKGIQVIGFVGRLAHAKGIDELVLAWKELRLEYPEARMLLVGPISAVDPISEETRRLLHDDPRVILAGFVENVIPYYMLMTLLVYPSHREGFPNVPMEAGALKLPVITTKVSGCVDAVIDGSTGTIIPPRNHEAIASAIRRYLNDPGLCQRHGHAGRSRVESQYRQEIIWDALAEEYTRLLKRSDVFVPREESGGVKPGEFTTSGTRR